MADDGLVNLEDDTPPAVAEPVAPVAEAAPPEPEALESVDLKDEAKVRGLIAELGRIRGENRDLRTRAERGDQAIQWLHEKRPYVEVLEANPDILTRREAAPVPAAQPTEDPDALEAAQLMDFYAPDGKPDIEKGRRYLAMQDRRASRVVQQAVQPLTQTNQQAQATTHYQQLVQLRHQDGTPVRKETVDAIWRRAAAEPGGLATLSQADSLPGLALMVLGADGMTRQATVPRPASEALVTEGSGGAGRPLSPVSALEEKVMKDRGISPKEWQERIKGFTPGRPVVLESD